jgi:cold shock CspA family protein
MIGQVVWFNGKYGFIQSSAGRFFFHRDNVVSGNRVALGEVVEFETCPAVMLGKPDQANNVRAAVDAEKKEQVGGGK